MIVLAAGLSSRFGEGQKVIRKYRGKPLLYYSLDACSHVAETIVVTGFERENVEECVSKYKNEEKPPFKIETVHNEIYKRGQLSSAIKALDKIADEDFAYCLSDIPYVNEKIVSYLKDEFLSSCEFDVLRPVCHLNLCHPVFFRSHCKDVIKSYLPYCENKKLNDIISEKFIVREIDVSQMSERLFFDVDEISDLGL